MATTVTDQIVALAEKAGLRPAWQPAYRGVTTIALNGEGPSGVFGSIHVGSRSGRVLRAELVHGNGGPTRTYTGAVEVRAALKTLSA
jgi:hypothetical protein